MKKIIVVIALAFAFTLGTVFSVDIATALKPATEVLVTNTEPIPVIGISSSPICPEENVQHWMAVRFKTGGSPSTNVLTHPTLPNIKGDRESEIAMQYSPDVATDIGTELIAHLNSLGYQETGNKPVDGGTVSSPAVDSYSTICAEN